MDTTVEIHIAVLHASWGVSVESAYLNEQTFIAHCDAMDCQCDEAKDGSYITRHDVLLVMPE